MKRVIWLVLLFTGCAPLSRVNKLEAEKYVLFHEARELAGANEHLREMLLRTQNEVEIQRLQITQAIELQAKYKPYADAEEQRNKAKKK